MLLVEEEEGERPGEGCGADKPEESLRSASKQASQKFRTEEFELPSRVAGEI